MGACQSTLPQLHQHKHGDHNNKPDHTNHTEGIHISEEFTQNNHTHKPIHEPPTTHPILLEIERFQTASGRPMGRILDAGTGVSSMEWIRHLWVLKEEFGVTGWTAVTASPAMAKDLKEYANVNGMMTRDNEDNNSDDNEQNEDPSCRGVVLGNWFADGNTENEDSKILLEGELYDTIFIDYLIGSIDGYTPYMQDCIFERLKKHLKPGGRMFLTGLEPIPEKESGPSDILCQTKRIRDACILLGGDRCYREYPMDWVLRNMERSSLRIISHKRFPLRHSMADIAAQLRLAKSKLPKITARTGNEGLACMMRESIAMLERKARTVTRNSPGKSISQGSDYLVIAELPPC